MAATVVRTFTFDYAKYFVSCVYLPVERAFKNTSVDPTKISVHGWIATVDFPFPEETDLIDLFVRTICDKSLKVAETKVPFNLTNLILRTVDEASKTFVQAISDLEYTKSPEDNNLAAQLRLTREKVTGLYQALLGAYASRVAAADAIRADRLERGQLL